MKGAVSVKVYSEGKVLPESLPLVRVDVECSANRIPRAELVYDGGDAATVKYALADGGKLAPGKKIRVEVKYEGSPGAGADIFIGVVVRSRVKAIAEGSHLKITLKSEAYRMTGERKTAIFTEKTDGKIIPLLFKSYGIKPVYKLKDAGTVKYAQLMQYNTSDWDFLLERCRVNGLLILSKAGALTIQKPELTKKTGSKKIKVGLSELIAYDMELDGERAAETIQTLAYEGKTQKSSVPKKAKSLKLGQGANGLAKIGKALKLKTRSMFFPAGAEKKELMARAESMAAYEALRMLRGSLTLSGTNKCTPGEVIELESFPKEFSGGVFISGLRHRIDPYGWKTDLEFGYKEGLLPTTEVGLTGLQAAVVEKVLGASGNQTSIQVRIPGCEGTNNKLWAKYSAPQAGAKHGFFTLPEVGDEVLLGFLNSDPSFPVVLGGMYSEKNKPPAKFSGPSSKKLTRGIVTRGGLSLLFDDEKSEIRLGNEKTELIIDAKGFQLISNGKMTLDAKGAMDLKTDDALELNAKKTGLWKASKGLKLNSKKIDLN